MSPEWKSTAVTRGPGRVRRYCWHCSIHACFGCTLLTHALRIKERLERSGCVPAYPTGTSHTRPQLPHTHVWPHACSALATLDAFPHIRVAGFSNQPLTYPTGALSVSGSRRRSEAGRSAGEGEAVSVGQQGQQRPQLLVGHGRLAEQVVPEPLHQQAVPTALLAGYGAAKVHPAWWDRGQGVQGDSECRCAMFDQGPRRREMV